MVRIADVKCRKVIIRNYRSAWETKQLEEPPGWDIRAYLAQIPDAEVIEDLYVTYDGHEGPWSDITE